MRSVSRPAARRAPVPVGRWLALPAAAVFGVVAMPRYPLAAAAGKNCPAGMALVAGTFCIDKYEAHVVEIVGKGKTRPHSPYAPVDGLKVKAVSLAGKVPQAYISRDQAEAACKNAGKRLCTDDEWLSACRGRRPTLYPYGDEHREGYCNDRGVSSFNRYYGSGAEEAPKEAYTWENMNDPRLNELPGTLAKTGQYRKCRNSFGVHDMVGNLHEWTASKSGTFRGGYYLDTKINGEGCDYKTTAHDAKYRDYSTGFRCCR